MIAGRGGRIQVAPGTVQALSGLPDGVDQASGRIVAEALCNAARHADHDQPVVFAAERATGQLDLLISNHVAERTARSLDSMGLLALRQHAEVVGGRAESSRLGDVWVCTASLPVAAAGGAR